MRILLTGGSACGKSTLAEALGVKLGQPLYYIAAMEPYGEESQLRIARHRRLRANKGFETIERYRDLAGLTLPQTGIALLECLCNLTANEMFSPGGSGPAAYQAVCNGVESLSHQCRHLIVVTNEVGGDGGGYDPLTTAYIEVLGRINRELAQDFDVVSELVCGIPLQRKGVLP